MAKLQPENRLALTKLEVFTLAAMQGFSSRKLEEEASDDIIAHWSVSVAKATLDALAKEQGIKIE